MKLGRSSKLIVKGPLSPHAVGVAVEELGGKIFDAVDCVVVLDTSAG